jgi:hypothetical protein
MEEFERHIFESVKQSVTTIAADVADRIYALSFFIYDDDDDPRRPRLTFGYNTLDRWAECTPAEDSNVAWPVASDSAEAKWNYAFWLQNEMCVIGAAGTKGAALRQEWIKSLGLAYSDDEEGEDFERCMRLGGHITERFVALCAQVSRALHDGGTITGKFGRPVPIIVHELEYYDEIADQTRRANPPGLTSEFEDWVRGEGARQ